MSLARILPSSTRGEHRRDESETQTMSSTPDWMRGGEDTSRPVRAGPPLGGVIIWTLALVVTANIAIVLLHLFG
jgi:hypothetical protein